MTKKLFITILALTTLQPALAMKRDRKEKVTETPSRKKALSQEELNKSLLAEILQIQPESNLDAIRQLLEQGADANMVSDKCTAFFFAIKKDNAELVQLLLDHHAQVDAPSGPFGMTALMSAARYGNLPMCKLLIANGANVQAQDGMGLTSLNRAKDHRHDEICALLEKHGAKKDNLPTAKYKQAWVLDTAAFDKMMATDNIKTKGKK
jgi:ankyrin repeat protein